MCGGGAGPDEEGREVLAFGFNIEDKDPEDVDEKVQTDSEETDEGRDDVDCTEPSIEKILSEFGTSSLGFLCVKSNPEVGIYGEEEDSTLTV